MTESPRMNAFQYLMESREKVIGRNSPGREVEDSPEPNCRVEEKLSSRKSFLEGWSEKKGASKRKREYELKGEFIQNRLEERAVRFKKMLKINNGSAAESETEEDDVGCVKKTKCKVLDSESENSRDSGSKVDMEDIHDSANIENKLLNKSENKSNTKQKSRKKRQKSKWKCKIRLNLSNDVQNEDNASVENNIETRINEIDSEVEMQVENYIATDENSSGAKEGTEEGSIIVLDESLKQCTTETEENSTGNTELSITTRSLRPRKSKVQYSMNDDDFEPDIQDKRKSRKKDVLLAPIFLKSAQKQKIDPKLLEAKKNFLFSGIPDQLRNERAKEKCIEDIEYDVFPKISHVLQSPSYLNWSVPSVKLKFLTVSDIDFNNILSKFKINQQSINEAPIKRRRISYDSSIDIKKTIRTIKEENPDYPVFRTFKTIREKHGNVTLNRENQKISEKVDKHETWSEKYKPGTATEILSNQKPVTFLMDWLKTWSFTPATQTSDRDSDFVCSDEDSNKSHACSSLLLSGPCGSGKTSSVYAVCNELGFKVLEVNASSKRTGKWLSQELQEATQSHQVRNKHATSLNTNKKCVLLIEDVDLVFEQDDGFLTVLAQIMATSKRPIVLTTNNETSANVQKFLTQCHLLRYAPVGRLHLTYLSLICIAEGLYMTKDDLEHIFSTNRGDMRKTLLDLQFLSNSCSKVEDTDVGNDDSENLYVMENLSKETLWSNIPKLLDLTEVTNTRSNKKEYSESEKRKLMNISMIFDTFSTSDLWCNETSDEAMELKKLKDSVELNECEGEYKDGFIQDLTHSLLLGMMKQHCRLDTHEEIRQTYTEEKRNRSKILRYEQRLESHLPGLTRLDYKSLASDYMPAVRSIARCEMERESNNGKRKNRFYNYLNNINVDCDDPKLKTYTDVFKPF